MLFRERDKCSFSPTTNSKNKSRDMSSSTKSQTKKHSSCAQSQKFTFCDHLKRKEVFDKSKMFKAQKTSLKYYGLHDSMAHINSNKFATIKRPNESYKTRNLTITLV